MGEEELRWLLIRRAVDPLLEEYGVEAVEAILDALSQRPSLLDHARKRIMEVG